MAKDQSKAAAQEWRSHWKLVLSAGVGMSMSGILISSLGAFIVPLETSLQWSRTQITSGLFFYAVIGVICAPFYGRLVDRIGPRRLGLPGVLLCGGAAALFSTTTGSMVQWLALWFIYALAAQVPKPLTWTAAVSSEFEASRGLALALVLIGGTIGGIVAPIVANHLIASTGWRSAYLVMGLGWGSLAFAVCYPFFFGRSDRLRTAPVRKASADSGAPLAGMTAREGLMSSRFLRLAITTLLANSLNVGLLVHMIPLLESTGMPASQATWLAGLAHIGGIIGALVIGALVDRIAGNRLGAICYLLPGIATAGLLIPSDSVYVRLAPVLLLTFAGGAIVHLFSYLTTRYFGLRAYGAIFGVIASVMSLGVGVGPMVGGFIFDMTKSYDLFLLAGVPIAIFNAILILSLGRYPDFAGDGEPCVTPDGQ